ncbi:Hypp771 [Branchiostoma lanceolatum]|uniref:Hypp771 protein n=1 Tax=Branchiostoma lanceolatum TaxID=7740 RepID=A0A8J9YPM0_BRALA|nr:Hypp771 [Branchiostoma lanceolatum]
MPLTYWKEGKRKFVGTLQQWGARSLSFTGKVTVANALAAAKLWYLASVFIPPDSVIKGINIPWESSKNPGPSNEKPPEPSSEKLPGPVNEKPLEPSRKKPPGPSNEKPTEPSTSALPSLRSSFSVHRQDESYPICKKLSGEGKGTAEWCTNVENERGQILTNVQTCEESVEKLGPMAAGLTSRYRKAGEATPQVMYVDRGCCAAYGVSSVEQLFGEWVADGMLTRLDAFHWMHRFDAAVRTDHHPKYALFKSALSAAVFAYNKEDLGPKQETFARVEFTINTLKGPARMDDNQVHLFKDIDAIDKVWEAQQKHIECIQDPPDMPMYTITKYATKNGHRLPYYATVKGSNSLEGFHKFLPDMIPGPHFAAIPFQD